MNKSDGFDEVRRAVDSTSNQSFKKKTVSKIIETKQTETVWDNVGFNDEIGQPTYVELISVTQEEVKTFPTDSPQGQQANQTLILPEFDMRNYEFALSARADHFLNWGGKNEKWLIGNWFVDFRPTGPVWYDARGVGRQYYFITPTGELYAWDHQSGGTYDGEVTGTLIALLGTEYYNNVQRIVMLMPEDRPLVATEPAVLDVAENNIIIADSHPIIKTPSPEPILGSTLLPDYVIAQASGNSNIDNVPIIKVTTLDPTGPGSLYEALMTEGERIIVFEVGGVIDFTGLSSDHELVSGGKVQPINIDHPHCVVAGETAPAPGITIIGASLHIRASHVLIRHVYVRYGNFGKARPKGNALGIIGFVKDQVYENILIDHCSLSWGLDQCAMVEPRGPGAVDRGICRYITIQNTIISEGLTADILSDPSKKAASQGLLLAGNGTNHVLIKRCLFTNHNKRLPFNMAHGSNAAERHNSAIVVNSIIYSPRQQATQIQGSGDVGPKLAMFGNLFIPGPDTKPYITVAERATLAAVPGNSTGKPGGLLDGRFTGIVYVTSQETTDIKVYLNDNELIANAHLHNKNGGALSGGFDYNVSTDCQRAQAPFNGLGGTFVANYSDTGLDEWLDKDSDLDLITSAVLKSNNYRTLLDDVGANPSRSSFDTAITQYTSGDSVDDRIKNQLLNLGSATGNSWVGSIPSDQNDVGGYPNYVQTNREYNLNTLLPVPIGPSGDHIVGGSGGGSGTAGWTVEQQLLTPNYDYLSIIPPLTLPAYGHTGDQIDSIEDPKTRVPLSRISRDEGLGITVSSDDNVTREISWKQYNTHLTQPQSFNSDGSLLLNKHVPLANTPFGGSELVIDQQQLTEDRSHPFGLGSSTFTVYTAIGDERIYQAIGATTATSTHDAEENSQTIAFPKGGMSLANQQLRFGKYTNSGDTQSRHVGLYFTGDNVGDICGNKIISATLELTATSDNTEGGHGGANFEGTWYGEDNASPSKFTSTDYDITNRLLTTVSAAGDEDAFGAQPNWVEGTQHTIDVTSIVQKLADSYTTLDGISLIWKYESGDGFRTAASANHASLGSASSPNRSPKLTINIDHRNPEQWKVGQSFTAGRSGFLQKIDVFLYGAQVAGICGATLNGDCFLEVWEGEPPFPNSGDPNLGINSAALGNRRFVIKQNINATGSGQWVSLDLKGENLNSGAGVSMPNGLAVEAGIKYSFIITPYFLINNGRYPAAAMPNFCIATANAPYGPAGSQSQLQITDKYARGTAILDSGDGVLRTDSYPAGNNDPSGTVSLDIEASEWDAEEVFQSYLFPQSSPVHPGGIVNDYAGVTYSGRDKGAIDPQNNLEGSGQLTFGGRQIGEEIGKYRQNYVGLHFESPANLGGKSIASASLRLYADGKKDFPQGPQGLLHGEKSNAPAPFLPSTDSSRAGYFYEMQCDGKLSIHKSHNAEEVVVANDAGHYVGQMELANQQLRFGEYTGTNNANARHVGLWFHHRDIANLTGNPDSTPNILSATLELTATNDNTESGHGGTDFEGTWYGEKNITPVQFKDTDNNITDRFSNLTDTSVDGSSPSANCLNLSHWQPGTAHTIDVTNIVQEIVDHAQTTAQSLSAIVLIWKYESGDGFRTVVSASNQASGSESDPNRSPKLTIVLKNDPQAIINRSLTTTTKDLAFDDPANQWETGFQYFDVKDIIQELADTYSGIAIPLEKLNLVWVGPATNHIKSRNAVAFDHGGTNVDGASINPTMARAKLTIEYVNSDYDPNLPSGGNFPYDLKFRTHISHSDFGKGGMIVYDGGDLLGKTNNLLDTELGAESGTGPTRQYEPLLYLDKLPADHIVWSKSSLGTDATPTLAYGLHYNNLAPSTQPATGSIAGQGLQSPSANAESQNKKVTSINIQAMVKPTVGSGRFTAKISVGNTTSKVEEYLRTGSANYIKISKTINGEWLGSEIDKLQVQLHAVSDYGNVEFQCRCTAISIVITTENNAKETLLPNSVVQQGNWVGSHTDIDDTFIHGIDYHDDDSSYVYISALNQYIDNTKAMILTVDNQSAAISAISSNLSGTAANNDLITAFNIKRDTNRLGESGSPNGTPAYADFIRDFQLPFYKLKPNKNNVIYRTDADGVGHRYAALMGTSWSLYKDQQNILAGNRPYAGIDIWVYVVNLDYDGSSSDHVVVAAFNLSHINERYVTDNTNHQYHFVSPAPTLYYHQGQQDNNFYGPDEESLVFSNDGRHILVKYAAPEQDRGIATEANKSTDTNDVWVLLDVKDDAYLPGPLKGHGMEINIKPHNFSYMPISSSNAKGTDPRTGVPLADLGHSRGVLPLNDLTNPTFVSGDTILPSLEIYNPGGHPAPPEQPAESQPDEFLVGYSNVWAKAASPHSLTQPPTGVQPLKSSWNAGAGYPIGRVGRAICLNATKSREGGVPATLIRRGDAFWGAGTVWTPSAGRPPLGSPFLNWCSLSNPGIAEYNSELYEANPQHFSGSQNKERLQAQGRKDASDLGAAYVFASYGPGYTYDSDGDLESLGGLYRDEIIAYNVEDPNVGMVRLTWSRTNAWTNGNPASGGTPAEATYLSVVRDGTPSLRLIKDPAYAMTKVSISSDGTKLLYNTTWSGEGSDHSNSPYGPYNKTHHFVIDLVRAGLFAIPSPPPPVDSGVGDLQWAMRTERSRSFVSCSGVGTADSVSIGCEIKNYTLIPTADFYRGCAEVSQPCPPSVTKITETTKKIDGMIWYGDQGKNTLSDGTVVPSGQGPFWDKLIDHEDNQYVQTIRSGYLERELIVVMDEEGPETNIKWKDVTKIRNIKIKVWFDNVQPQHFDLLPSDGIGTEITLYKNIKNYDPLVTQNIGDFFATEHVRKAISRKSDQLPREELPSVASWDIERSDLVLHNSNPSSCPAVYDGSCNILTDYAFAVGIRRLSWNNVTNESSSNNVVAAVEEITLSDGTIHDIVLIADQTWANANLAEPGNPSSDYWDHENGTANQNFAVNLYPTTNFSSTGGGPSKGKNNPTHINVICLGDFPGSEHPNAYGGMFRDPTGANLAMVKCAYEANAIWPNAGGLRTLEKVQLNSSGTSVATIEGYEAGTAELAWITCPRNAPSSQDVENIKTWMARNPGSRLVISYEFARSPSGAVGGPTYRDQRMECENVNKLLSLLGVEMRIAEDGTNSTPPQYPVTNSGAWEAHSITDGGAGQPITGALHKIVLGSDPLPPLYDVPRHSIDASSACKPVRVSQTATVSGPVGRIRFGGISPIDINPLDTSRAPDALFVSGENAAGGILSTPQGTKILGIQVELEAEVCVETTTTTTTTTTPPPSARLSAQCLVDAAACAPYPECNPGSVLVDWNVPFPGQASYTSEIWNVTKNEIHSTSVCSGIQPSATNQLFYTAGIADNDTYQVKMRWYDGDMAQCNGNEIGYEESNTFSCAVGTPTTTTTTTTTTTLPPQGFPAGILLGNIGLAGFGSFTIPGIGPLPPVPPPPYPYPDPSPPEPIPHTPVVVEPSILHSTANKSTRLVLERDLFDPNRKIDGKIKTVQSIATSKGYNLSNYTPYQRTNKGLEKILYSEKIKTGMSVVLVDNNINVEDREKRLLSNIAAREILPARMKWPEE